MSRKILLLALLSTLFVPAAFADDLTAIIQNDLAALGYETGNTDGELSMETVIAISKFQSENGLEVTGEPTPQLAGIIKANSSPQLKAKEPEPQDAAALQAAQQACLQEKYEAAQKKQKTSRGISSLMSAVSRTAGQTGNYEVAAEISSASSDLYSANATASDLSSAAKDLGLTEDDVEACRNPS